jgi:hypothetical protein
MTDGEHLTRSVYGSGKLGTIADLVHRPRLFERALAGGRPTYEDVAAELGVPRVAVCQDLAI